MQVFSACQVSCSSSLMIAPRRRSGGRTGTTNARGHKRRGEVVHFFSLVTLAFIATPRIGSAVLYGVVFLTWLLRYVADRMDHHPASPAPAWRHP